MFVAGVVCGGVRGRAPCNTLGRAIAGILGRHAIPAPSPWMPGLAEVVMQQDNGGGCSCSCLEGEGPEASGAVDRKVRLVHRELKRLQQETSQA